MNATTNRAGADQPPTADPAARRSIRPGGAAARLPVVLIVDDFPDNLLALEGMLRRADVEIVTASSGREALEVLLERDVAVAILDVMMPEMDGFELAELIRGVERTRRVPIIFVTAAAKAEYRAFAGYELGAIDFLFKPLDEHVLRAKVDVLVALERQRREAERARTETEILLDLAHAISRAEKPAEIYDPCLDAVGELLGADRSAILLFDETDRMRFHAWRGLLESYRTAVDGHSPWARNEKDAKPILIPDVTKDDRMAAYRSIFVAEKIAAIGFVPLVTRALIGKLMLYWDRPRSFSERDEAIARSIALQVADALERLHLRETERRGHLLVARLQRVTASLNSVFTPQDVAAACIPVILETVGASAVMISLLNADSSALELIDSAGISPEAKESFRTIPLTAELAPREAIASRQGVFLESREAYLAKYPHMASAAAPHGSRGAIPMIVEDRVVGILGVALGSWRPFPEEDRAFLSAAASHCAQAFDRARLQDAERRAHEHVAQLQGVTALFNGAATRETIADSLRSICQIVGAANGGLLELSADGRELEVIAAFGVPPELVEHFRRHSVESNVATSEAVRSREPVFVESKAERDRKYGHVTAKFPDQFNGTQANIPLLLEGRVIGALTFGFSNWRVITSRERALLLAVAGQCALALDRARLLEAESHARAEAEAAEARRAFLADASAELAKSLDSDVALRNVAKLAVPKLADWCAVDMAAGPEGETTRVVVAHVDPAKVQLAHELRRRYPPDRKGPRGAPKVLRTGRSELYREIPDEMLVQGARDPDHLRIMREVGMESAIVVPIAVGGQTLGVISFVTAESKRRYDVQDLGTAEELGRRAGIAIENARLFEAERRARQDNEMFAAVLAHDLRNPLGAMLMATRLVLHRNKAEDDQALAPLRRVLSSGERMTRMIDHLLDFTRAREGGGFELGPRDADLAKICGQVLGEIELAHPEWKVKAESLGDFAGKWDPDRLLQVLSNLVNNAGQHGSPGSDILIKLDGTSGDSVSIDVHNKGAIPEELLPSIFAPFRGTRQRGSGGGLGLGLYITKEIVRSHGGTVDVISSEAAGTTFRVKLPRRTPPRGAPPGKVS